MPPAAPLIAGGTIARSTLMDKGLFLIAVLQRVRQARVEVDGAVVGTIGPGLLVLVCAERGDTEAEADKLLAKILKLRIFSDDAGKMNRSVQDPGRAGRLRRPAAGKPVHPGGRYHRRQPPQLHPGRSARRGPQAVRLRRGPGPQAAPRGGHRPVCGRYAGAPGQRRAGDHSDADRASGHGLVSN